MIVWREASPRGLEVGLWISQEVEMSNANTACSVVQWILESSVYICSSQDTLLENESMVIARKRCRHLVSTTGIV